jgi:hypothetical protein
MSGKRSLLTWGRGGTLLIAGGFVASFLAGWIRRSLLLFVAPLMTSLDWIPLRGIALGVFYDLPPALVVVVFCGLAGRFIVLSPWTTPLALAGLVWLLDLVVAWLVLDDLGLWTDPVVSIPRLVIAVTAVVTSAVVLGWRPRRRRLASSEPSSEATDDDDDESDAV